MATPDMQIRVFSPEKQTAFLSLVTSARSECLSLSTMIYKKFPREIRDIVYSYLCVDDRQLPIGPYYHYRSYWPPNTGDPPKPEIANIEPFSEVWYIEQLSSSKAHAQTIQPDGRIRTDHDIYPQSDLLMPEDYVFHPSYMGKEIALETLKTYYESNSFSVCNVEGGLDSLCAPATLGSETTEFVPIDHICDLQIRIKCEHFTLPNADHECSWEPLKEFVLDEPFLRNTVESFATFRSKIQTTTARALNIEIVLMSDLITKSQQYRLINMLQTFRNFVYELMHDREHTTVRITHQDESIMAFPRNYTGLFQLNREQWGYVSALSYDSYISDIPVLTSSRRSPDSNQIMTGVRISGSSPSKATSSPKMNITVSAATIRMRKNCF